MASKLTRRQFVRSLAAGAAVGPLIVSAKTLGRDGGVAASERITLGCIGVGGQGTANLMAFLRDPRIQVVAICDVDREHRANALAAASLKEPDGYNDFREVTGRADVDAVSICTPDHWHAVPVIEAANSGKDIFCEKPLSLTLAEGKRMVEVVRETGRVFQTGTWRRSREMVRRACELVRNGRIGQLHTIRAGVPEGYAIRGGDFDGPQPEMPVPDGFDYNFWLGPAPDAPYTAGRCHFNFRWILDYSAGYITDWGAHYYDVAQWGNGTDDTGPVGIEGTAEFPTEGLYNASIKHRIEYTYANGVKLIAATTLDTAEYGVRFEGSEGWIWAENGELKASSKAIEESEIGANEIHLYSSDDHHRNFVDKILDRGETAAPVEIGHHSAAICHLGHIATTLKRPLKWDPARQEFPGDDEANALRARPMRGPWALG